VRPSQEDLLETVRISLRDTVLPAIEDRWARYVAQAMDLVLQHVQLRVTGEVDALTTDNADMVTTLAEVTTTAAAAGSGSAGAEAERWAALAALAPQAAADPGRLQDATALNEALRCRTVEVLRWLDDNEPHVDTDALEELRGTVHRLIRRQTDRQTAFVEPLFMSFGPAVAS
jgi:hypothetical protein